MPEDVERSVVTLVIGRALKRRGGGPALDWVHVCSTIRGVRTSALVCRL